MAASVHMKKVHKCTGRNAAATMASVSFLVLVFLVASAPHDDLQTFFFPRGSSPQSLTMMSQGGGGGEQQQQRTSSCQEDLQRLPDAGARCRYLSSAQPHPPCAPRGYVDYLRVFYCGFGRNQWLGSAASALWLAVLFYLLGDTASQYFCAALEGLSAALRLPPAVAGATLLSLGNGAPDVLSSVVAFASSASTAKQLRGGGGGKDAGDVGLSGVLGGALFVSTAVAGVVAIVAGRGEAAVVIDRRGFVRDACFLLLAMAYLLAVLLTGSVTVWAAASFLSLYAGYVLLVWTSHCCNDNPSLVQEEEDCPAIKPATAAAAPNSDEDLAVPLLIVTVDVSSDNNNNQKKKKKKTMFRLLLDLVQAPLYLPRRLTIPDIAAHRWSKPYAVASAFFAPVLLLLATSHSFVLAGAGVLAGAVLAAAVARSTTTPSPPDTNKVPWLAGGFLMSVLWSYVVARELVALLVAAGLVAGVRGSVLGATVLAWGNSLGDLVADVAMAAHGGAQTAVAGCYAGPAFNAVVGLGLSLTLAAGARYPEAYVVPVDASAYQAMGFLAGGLVWALVVLPLRGMRLDRVLGVGLLAVYACFLCVRLASLSSEHY